MYHPAARWYISTHIAEAGDLAKRGNAPMLARLAVLAVAVSARKTEHRSRALTTADYDPEADPGRIISQCIQFKEEGAFWDRTKEFQKNFFREIMAKEIVVIIPAGLDNMTATDHSAPEAVRPCAPSL